ncbi:putative pyruvate dehydrogenase protein X component, mitochondrial [Smittium mucronatum]|uniref:Putative pyruvate dehydrogenase protein X component, mitochondrial n=1 Tax=Smittium mucronatum TaxID=133383 RepID=A0A1R0H5Z4_9FUNG|nr:putative pyruvate dehydrogenase protein X component, mitochondrial [Smittium mucronatum]
MFRFAQKSLKPSIFRNVVRYVHSTAPNGEASELLMPSLSPTMTEGKISSWSVKEGDSFTAGQVLLVIETDKAQMDVEATDDGIMGKILIPEGSAEVSIGVPIAILAEEGDDLSNLKVPESISAPAPASAPAPKESEPSPVSNVEQKVVSSNPATPVESPRKNGYSNNMLSPSAEYLVKSQKISDYSTISGTGLGGRIMKGDILNLLKSNPSTTVTPAAPVKAVSPLPNIVSDSDYLVSILEADNMIGFNIANFYNQSSKLAFSFQPKSAASTVFSKELSAVFALAKAVADSLLKQNLVTKDDSISLFTSSSGNCQPIVAPISTLIGGSITDLPGQSGSSKPSSGNIAVVTGALDGDLIDISNNFNTIAVVSRVYKALSEPVKSNILDSALDSLLHPNAPVSSSKSSPVKQAFAVDISIKSKDFRGDIILPQVKSLLSQI